jgi:hypothetical protein
MEARREMGGGAKEEWRERERDRDRQTDRDRQRVRETPHKVFLSQTV